MQLHLSIAFLGCLFGVSIALDPLESAEAFEGDIILSPDQRSIVDGQSTEQEAFEGTVKRKWPNGIIPYEFTSNFDQKRRQIVNQAIAEYRRYTCIQWRPKTASDRAYVGFYIGGGCASSIGRQGAAQYITLGGGCEEKYIAIHEMMHAAGVWHEQSRRDRDQHINILWHNLRNTKDVRHQFRMYSHGEADTYGLRYDVRSVMHYGNYMMSVDEYTKPTIEVIRDRYMATGNKHGFSPSDVQLLRKMYNCGGGPLPQLPPATTHCADQNAKCAEYAKNGDCNRNSGFMNAYCKTSCGKCGPIKGGTGTTNNRCIDKHPSCPDWAAGNQCSLNWSYMRINCQKSCRVC